MAASTPGSSRMWSTPAAAIATNQITMIGAKKLATLAVPRLCAREQREQDDDGQRHDVVVEGGRDELKPFDRRQHRDRRRDQRRRLETSRRRRRRAGTPARCAGRARASPARSATSVPPSPLLSARSRSTTYLSVTTMISDHRISESTPSTTVAGDRAGLGRRHHRLAERVERAGADIAVDDADAAERQRPQARIRDVTRHRPGHGPRRTRYFRSLHGPSGQGQSGARAKRGAAYITAHPQATCSADNTVRACDKQ